MQNRLYKNIKNILPYLGLSVAVGFFSAILITVFKFAAEQVIHGSAALYGAVRENPVWLPVLVVGTAAVGLAASLILSKSHSCRGGGIPSSVATIRGIVSFKWLSSAFVLPISALLTFLCGLPLGTEGPCVQMGTAIGDGVVKCLGAEKHKGWRRYIMTGGATAGFSLATASPVTAIIFSVEELHKRLSPLVLVGVSVSVITAQITSQLFTLLGIESGKLFHIAEIGTISPKLLFAPLLVGVICGLCSIMFTRVYHLINRLVSNALKKISIKILLPIIFAGISIVGFFLSDTLGTGHGLVDSLLSTHKAWYLLILVFLIRVVTMMVSNTSGVTGGVFLPTLAFGAIIGALCADGMIALGWLEADHYILMVVLGITAFLGANSRIPITACVFAVEALAGVNNVVAIIIAATAAFLIAEHSGVEDFSETIIEAKVHAVSQNKEPEVNVKSLIVRPGSLAVGKNLHDILWPNCCVVVAFHCAHESHDGAVVDAGDVITVRYKTYDPDATAEEFEVLVGKQPEGDDYPETAVEKRA